MRRVLAVSLAVFLIACGGANQAASTSSPQRASIVDGTGCTSEQKQALTFAGPIAGQLTCSAPSATCTYSARLHEFFGTLHSRTGKVSVMISFFIPYRDPGDYSLASTQGPEIDVDGPSHWRSSSGTVSILPVTTGLAQGSMHATLDGKPGTITLNGTWVCSLTLTKT